MDFESQLFPHVLINKALNHFRDATFGVSCILKKADKGARGRRLWEGGGPRAAQEIRKAAYCMRSSLSFPRCLSPSYFIKRRRWLCQHPFLSGGGSGSQAVDKT